ncbi:MAG: hypothetical protein WD669_11925 [Pirellulales bacterium]
MHSTLTEIDVKNNGVADSPTHRADHRTAPQASDKPQDSVQWTRFGLLVVELVGLTCVIGRYQLESAAFLELFLLAMLGFSVHYFLPLKYRLGFFLCLSLASIALVLGIVQGAWLVALGLVLIGIAHLAIPFAARLTLLLTAGLILAAIRAGWAPAPWSPAIWPILGAMFMFRLIVYVYDLKHGQAPASWSERLSYFFMLPNVCFPLFPVIDSRMFSRSYYDGDRHDIHQRGIEWIARGLIQLILYRLVYQNMVIDPIDVGNVADLAHYCLWLFLLYLRVSGQFHVIVGMLHLFGFNLPETHRLYYFASSFTDFWRRINIYWKDFMMKVFYYPVYFRARRLGPTLGIVLSTAIVFGLTWALHAYQLFWIRGAYVFTWNDLLFWSILCGLVVVNSLWESRFGRQRTISKPSRTWKDTAALALKTCATFVVICILWSFWSSASLSSWFSLWPAALVPPTSAQFRTIGVVAAVGLAALGLFLAWKAWVDPYVNRRFELRTAVVLCELFILNLLSISAVYGRMGWVGEQVATARFGGLNVAEMANLERGYYEDLLTVDRFNGELAAMYAKRPPGWVSTLKDLNMELPAAGLQYELRPQADVIFKGASFRTNRWGMHDRDYSKQRPDGYLRIALLGASHVMGTGVEMESTFDSVLERRLNREHPDSRFQGYEILNFAVYGYKPVEQIQVLREKALPFGPNALLYVGHPGDADRVVLYLSRAVESGAELRYPFLSQIVQRAGVSRETPVRLIQRRLQPFGEEILSWVYQTMIADCNQKDIPALFALLPMVPESAQTHDTTPDLELAKAAGFQILDLGNVYHGHNRQSLWIAEWDAHPNARGHELIGDRLYELLQGKWQPLFSEIQP